MKLYRIVDSQIYDTFGELRSYDVLKATPKGHWIHDPWYNRNRFVLSTATKRFAHLSFEDALKSFKYRKMRQLVIYRARFERLTDLVSAMQGINLKPENFVEADPYFKFEE